MSRGSSKGFWAGLLEKILKIILKGAGMRTRPPTYNQHVVPHPDGWAVKGEGNQKYTAIFDTQSRAIDRARDIAIGHKSDVIIHRGDGTIRDRMSYD